MGIQDRDWYKEDQKRRDKLPHVTDKSNLVHKALKPKVMKKKELPLTVFLTMLLVGIAFISFGLFKFLGY